MQSTQAPPTLQKPDRAQAVASRGWSVLAGLVAAVQFLTIAPLPSRRTCTDQEMGRAVGWFPLVGLLLGGLLLGVHELGSLVWTPALVSGLVLAAWIVATGALHLDGLLDCCDGLFGGRTAEDRLRIMKDSRVGAFAVVGGSLFVLLKYLALASVADSAALLLAPVLGRGAMVLGILVFPYARAEGLGRAMKDHAGWLESLLAALTVCAAAWLYAGERGLAALAVAVSAVWLVGRLALRRLPGLTGDVYGACCELVELLVLLIFAARFAP